MTIAVPQLNLVFAWIWILAGFVSGMFLGLKFHDENWLGGYSSFKRRMYRLGHISFFGLGAVNLFFYLSMPAGAAVTVLGAIASITFVTGAVTMPLCCWAMAWNKRFQYAFAVPVVSLITGAAFTILEVL